jgi:hypothetical protein
VLPRGLAAKARRRKSGKRQIKSGRMPGKEMSNLMTNDLESIYQEAIAAVPRAYRSAYSLDVKDEDFPEKGHGFLESDLLDEMVKRMTEGTDQQKRSAAAALIERKTEQHRTVLWVTLPGVDGPMPVYPDQLYRWDGWLCESKHATVRWVHERVRQVEEATRKAKEEEYLNCAPPVGCA